MNKQRFAIIALLFTAMLLLMAAGLVVVPAMASTATPTIVHDADVLEWPDKLETIQVTIVTTTSLSGPVDLNGLAPVALQMPATWTTANLTLQGSPDCSTYNNVYDMYGTEYTITAGASRYIVLKPGDFAGFKCLKVRSGTSGTPVNQVGAEDSTRLLTLMLRVL